MKGRSKGCFTKCREKESGKVGVLRGWLACNINNSSGSDLCGSQIFKKDFAFDSAPWSGSFKYLPLPLLTFLASTSFHLSCASFYRLLVISIYYSPPFMPLYTSLHILTFSLVPLHVSFFKFLHLLCTSFYLLIIFSVLLTFTPSLPSHAPLPSVFPLWSLYFPHYFPSFFHFLSFFPHLCTSFCLLLISSINSIFSPSTCPPHHSSSSPLAPRLSLLLLHMYFSSFHSHFVIIILPFSPTFHFSSTSSFLQILPTFLLLPFNYCSTQSSLHSSPPSLYFNLFSAVHLIFSHNLSISLSSFLHLPLLSPQTSPPFFPSVYGSFSSLW